MPLVLILILFYFHEQRVAISQNFAELSAIKPMVIMFLDSTNFEMKRNLMPIYRSHAIQYATHLNFIVMDKYV